MGGERSAGCFVGSFCLAGVRLDVESDDPHLLDELSSTLGKPVAAGGPAPSLAARVTTKGSGGFGLLRLEAPTGLLPGQEDFLLGLSSPQSPFRALESEDPSRTDIAFLGEDAPFFSFRAGECRFRQAPHWRTAVTLLLFHRLLQLRDDVIFFHAASVAVLGRGTLLVGPKGAGKSTVALALAARGHGFLGDETAGYLPATGEILPVRRPVGIKPGPRARAVAEALARLGRRPETDGILRIDVETLLDVGPAATAPLRAVVFLGAFSAAPEARRISPGREEVALLQPFVGSLVNAARARRVFEMARLLAGTTVYRLSPGDPDETARALEEVLAAA